MEEKDQKIAYLETKLAESEEQCRDCKHLNKKIELNIKNKLMAENCELQKQLAEKDKNNLILYSMLYETLEKQGYENVASQIDQMTGFTLDKQAKWFKENRNCDELLKLLEEKDQDKISFAVEQLEKVKSAFGLINSKLDKVETIKEYIHYIDHQINELKEKTNVKD